MLGNEIIIPLIIICTSSALFSSIFTSLLFPFAHDFGFKYKILDIPNPRKIHKKPTPRTGGLVIVCSFYISLLITILVSNFFKLNLFNFDDLYTILVGSSLFALIGIFDDILSASAFKRLFLQIIISSLIFSQGIRIESIAIFPSSLGNIIEIHPSISFLITIIWITGLTNAINWVDGIDGLLSIFTLVSLITFSILSFNFLNPIYLIICSILIGIIISFFFRNISKNKIFMGDTGSFFFGSIQAILAINISTRYDVLVQGKSLNIFNPYIPLLIFSLPILDMIRVIISRIFKGKSPFYSDKNHLHHLLSNLDFNNKQILLIVFSIIQFTSILAILVANNNFNYALIISSFFCGSLLIFFNIGGKK